MNKFGPLFQTILELRTATLQILPVTDQAASRIRYDILIWLSASWSSGTRLTVKQLYAQLPHSDSAIRQHFDLLLDEGWIELEDDNSDRRIRYVVPSEQLVTKIVQWGDNCTEILFKYDSSVKRSGSTDV